MSIARLNAMPLDAAIMELKVRGGKLSDAEMDTIIRRANAQADEEYERANAAHDRSTSLHAMELCHM